jgi:hypothetical protein
MEPIKPQSMPARAKRKRTWMAVLAGNIKSQFVMFARRCEPGCRKKDIELAERRACSGLGLPGGLCYLRVLDMIHKKRAPCKQGALSVLMIFLFVIGSTTSGPCGKPRSFERPLPIHPAVSHHASGLLHTRCRNKVFCRSKAWHHFGSRNRVSCRSKAWRRSGNRNKVSCRSRAGHRYGTREFC